VKNALWQRLAVIAIGALLLVSYVVIPITLIGFVGIIMVVAGIISAIRWMWQHDGEETKAGQ
jgi:uncharacterized membrane protein HdeD (DUF308 family)